MSEDKKMADAEKAARKAEKKAKKAAKKAAEAERAALTNGAAIEVDEDEPKVEEDEEMKKRAKKEEKRRKKEEKKRKRESGEEESEPKAVAAINGEGRSSKKAKVESVDSFLAENEISHDPESAASEFPPTLDFADLEIEEGLRNGLAAFAKPTPIQSASFPIMMGGKDVIGIAETGSVNVFTASYGARLIRRSAGRARRSRLACRQYSTSCL